MKMQFAGLCAVLVLVSGCWTVRETEYPTVSVPAVPAGKTVKVKFANNWPRVYLYDTFRCPYVPVPGHEKITPGNMRSGQALCIARGISTNAEWSIAQSAQMRIVGRLSAELLAKGYTVTDREAQYVIGFRYEYKGPRHGVFAEFVRKLSHLWTAGWNESDWTARMTVYDGSGMKELFTKTYEQSYDAKVWGPIPVFSPACNDKMLPRAADSWVCTAIADRALQDAATFIVSQLQ